ERDVIVDEASALGPEEDAAGLLGGDEAVHLLGGTARGQLALYHVAVARGRGVDVGKIGDRGPHIRIEPRLVQDEIGAARGIDRLIGRPAVARPHEAEIVEAAIQHGARRGADILAELRLDEDDRRAAGHAIAALVSAGHLWAAP